ncbi:alpha-L-fucosidase [Actinomycetes bacterium]|nr:alpha-L-fucosidase [Actinomycetes bacterium]
MCMGKYTGDFDSLNAHELPSWFNGAKFGIFVHWYPSTMLAYAPITDDPFTLAREKGEKEAFTESPYSEWYWNSLQFPESSVAKHHAKKYGDKPYEDFVPEWLEATHGWQPERWAELFSASGAMYCVMGTKHHDGVLLWPSATPNPHKGSAWSSSRDIVGECADAVRSEGMRFGVYYSGGIDWTFQGLGIDGWAGLYGAIPQDDTYHAYVDAHYRELISRYKPDVLWNDIGYPRFGEGSADLMAHFYNTNPEGVVNDRFDFLGVMAGKSHADFTTPEYTTKPAIGTKKFEVCRGIGTSFGYNEAEDDSSYASPTELIHMLVNIVASGGNLLLNVGPMATGEIPWAQQERLLAIGQWLSVNGDAIYSSSTHSQSSLVTSEGLPVRLTAGIDGGTYAIVMGRPSGKIVHITGLPQGETTLLGYDGLLQRIGDDVILPFRPDNTPAFTLRVL